MKHRGIRNMLTFLLALVLTAAVVGVLSAATRVPAETARAAQTVQAEQPEEAAGQLTAVPHQESGTSVLAGVGGSSCCSPSPPGASCCTAGPAAGAGITGPRQAARATAPGRTCPCGMPAL